MFGCRAIHGGVGVSGFGTWVEGLKTAWGVKNNAEVACEWWGQGCGTCFGVDLKKY
jgi:hypothetical protein